MFIHLTASLSQHEKDKIWCYCCIFVYFWMKATKSEENDGFCIISKCNSKENDQFFDISMWKFFEWKSKSHEGYAFLYISIWKRQISRKRCNLAYFIWKSIKSKENSAFLHITLIVKIWRKWHILTYKKQNLTKMKLFYIFL